MYICSPLFAMAKAVPGVFPVEFGGSPPCMGCFVRLYSSPAGPRDALALEFASELCAGVDVFFLKPENGEISPRRELGTN